VPGTAHVARLSLALLAGGACGLVPSATATDEPGRHSPAAPPAAATSPATERPGAFATELAPSGRR
jgi:hypothetical protein